MQCKFSESLHKWRAKLMFCRIGLEPWQASCTVSQASTCGHKCTTLSNQTYGSHLVYGATVHAFVIN